MKAPVVSSSFISIVYFVSSSNKPNKLVSIDMSYFEEFGVAKVKRDGDWNYK